MNRFKSMIYLLVVIALMLSACTAAPTPPAAAPESTKEQEKPAEEKVPAQGETSHLAAVGICGGIRVPAAVASKNYEAENPNIKVEITDIPEGDYATKIDTALLAKEPPDLGYVYEAPLAEELVLFSLWIPTFSRKASILPIITRALCLAVRTKARSTASEPIPARC